MGHMADTIWPLLFLLCIMPASFGLGVGGWREAPTMAYRTHLKPEEAGWDLPLSRLPSESHSPAWEKKGYLGLNDLPPLFNMFGVQLPPNSGPKQWVTRNSGWSGLGGVGQPPEMRGGGPEKRGGGERVERSVVHEVVPWNMMYFSPMLRG